MALADQALELPDPGLVVVDRRRAAGDDDAVVGAVVVGPVPVADAPGVEAPVGPLGAERGGHLGAVVGMAGGEGQVALEGGEDGDAAGHVARVRFGFGMSDGDSA
jgi:hypothetical protein